MTHYKIQWQPTYLFRRYLIEGLGFFILIFGIIPSAQAIPDQIGEVKFARGSAAAQQPDEAPRLLGEHAVIFQGDNIQTSERSFVLIKFVDNTQVTVRPNTNVSIDTYLHRPDQKQAQLSLHQGGLRASTGAIAQTAPDNFKIKTVAGIVEAQQADYSVRLCQTDCAAENTQLSTVPAKTNKEVVARIVEIKGQVQAKTIKRPDPEVRTLAYGAPLYRTDQVTAQKDSYALLAFRDGGRMTLQADSSMAIASYNFNQQTDKPNQAAYNLITGGLRALTGAIGKVDRAAYKVDTPVASIGIRGTGFDLSCRNSATQNNSQSETTATINRGRGQGLYSSVWQGRISQTNAAGEFELGTGEANYIGSAQDSPIYLISTPTSLQHNHFPRPDNQPSDLNELFGTTDLPNTPPGLYVTAHDGHVALIRNDHERVDIGQQEAAYFDLQGKFAPIRLDEQQNFQVLDPYPLPSSVDIQRQGDILFSLLADATQQPRLDQVFECITE